MRSAASLAIAAALIALPMGAAAGTVLPAPTAMSRHQDNARLAATAAMFEQLTRTAYHGSLPMLGIRATKAEDAARQVRELLAPRRRPHLDVALANLRMALHGRARGAFARAAIDCSRLLLGGIRGKTAVPKTLALMIYADIRYRADLEAQPIRWQGMHSAAEFAHARWDSLAPEVRGTDLRFRTEEAVNGMQIGARERDPRLANRSSRLALRLAGDMRTQFAVRHAPQALS